MACGRSPSLPVLFYHAGIPGFPGGFVGVDIFFVISGYLICGMIDADIRSGSFSLGNFYKRRILRILPALFVDVPGHQRSGLCLLPAGRTRGLFEEPRQRGRFGFEHLLRRDRRIFRRARRNQALAAYLVAGRRGAVLPDRAVVDAVCLSRRCRSAPGCCLRSPPSLSFAAAFAVSYRNTTFVFYLTPFRAWELALGALLSIGFIPAPASRIRQERLRRRGTAAPARHHPVRIADRLPLLADDLARQHRRDAGDRFQRTREFRRSDDCCRCGRSSSSA